MVRSQLEAWGLESDLPALELAVSELVTNAVVHGRGSIEVRLSVAGECIRLEVGDEGRSGQGHVVRPAARGNGAVGGWGLRLVDDLSDAWGTGPVENGTHVWMERRLQGRDDGVDTS